MKKAIIVIVAILGCIIAAEAKDRVLPQNQIPAQITAFVKKHFRGDKISVVTEDKEWLSSEYKAMLSSGATLEFDSKFEWTEVDCNRQRVPASIVPGEIADYIAKHFPGKFPVKIDRDKRKWEVEIDNGTELTFDSSFRLSEIDD
ncbi:MAG: PepSY-like domain-containing protein [Muribaculaceae bacterium]